MTAAVTVTIHRTESIASLRLMLNCNQRETCGLKCGEPEAPLLLKKGTTSEQSGDGARKR